MQRTEVANGTAGSMFRLELTDAEDVNRCLRDIVALSTLPAVWLGAEPLRVAESLAAALFTTIGADLVYVSIEESPGGNRIALAQTGRYATDAALAARLDPLVRDWARTHDPDELLAVPDALQGTTLWMATRPLGFNASLGAVSVGFTDPAALTIFRTMLLNVAATQATTAVENAQLVHSLRETVAERKRAEEAAQREGERYRSLVSATTSIVWSVDDEGRYDEPQPSWEAYTGQTWDEYRDLGWLDAFHPEDRQRIHDLWLAARSRRTLYESSGRLWHAPSGAYRYFVARAVPVIESDGTVREWVGTVTDVDEARRAEQALAETEERLRLALQSTDIGTWDFNPASGDFQWSNRCRELFGLGPDTAVDYDLFLSRVHPEDRERTHQAVQQALDPAGDGSYHVEHRTLGEVDGGERWVDATGRAFFEGEGAARRAKRFIGTVIDTTARRRAEQARQQFVTLVEHSGDFTGMGTLDGRSIYVNPAGRALVGLDDLEAVRRTRITEFLTPETEELFARVALPAVLESGWWEGEVRFRHFKTGEPIDVYQKIFSIRDERSGALQFLATVAYDITDQKRVEAERVRRAQQLRQIAEAARVINSNLSVSEILRHVTDQARQIIGAHQAITSMTADQQWSQAINAVSLSDEYAGSRSDDAAPDGSPIYAAVCETNQPMRMTQEELERHPLWRGLGGEEHRHPPLRGWLAVPLIARSGGNLGLIQLTGKYEGEFTVEDEDILIQLAQLASAAIENASLYEQARAANAAKDEFFAILSHELRTPLTSILGWAQLCATGEPGEELTRQALASIASSAKTQARLVDDLLDVSRIMADKLDVERQPLDLSRVVDESLDSIRPSATVKGVVLVSNVDREVRITGDVARLRQVVGNLLSNAVKFTPAGGLVEARLTADKRGAVFSVRDTGAGIDAAFLARIFDRYEQAAIGRSSGGLGLGLWIVRQIVSLHGGTIRAFSEGPGKGATFTVFLPA